MTDRNNKVRKKKISAGGIRLLLHLLQHGAAAAAAFCVVVVLINTSVAVENMGNVRRYNLSLLGNEEAFGDSDLFLNIFMNQVSDVIEYVVIEKQVGSDGGYDGDKIIDISAYANRKDLDYDGSQPSARYRLEDLLKWYRDGIRYREVHFDDLEAMHSWLPLVTERETVVWMGNNASGVIYETEDGIETVEYLFVENGRTFAVNHLFELLREYGIDLSMSIRDDGELDMEFHVPEDKYQTADGRELKECAGCWEEYGMLVRNLVQSVNDLGYNYDIYMQMKEGLERQNTNLRYHVQITGEDGKVSGYTNEIGRHVQLESHYRQMEKYVIYDPYNLYFETNIPGFDEGALRAVMSGFEYTFRDNSKVYLGVDPGSGADDIYALAARSYGVMQHIWIYGAVAVAFLLAWIVLLAFLSVMAGRRSLEAGDSLEAEWFDYVPTELVFALAGIMIVSCNRENLLALWHLGKPYFVNVSVCLAALLSISLCICWYSLVRRLKMHILWKNSILGFLCRKTGKLIRAVWRWLQSAADRLQNQLGTVAATLIPLLFLMIGNIAVGFWGIYYAVDGYERGNFQEFLTGLLILLIVFLGDMIFAVQMVKNALLRKKIVSGIQKIRDGNTEYQVDTAEMHGENLELAGAVNSIGTGIRQAVETSMKDERLKADLITNVSHDIKTPLTSIINYVDLLKREKIETEPVKGYIEVLDAKSQRLKQLTDDLVEASKISSGNIVLNIERIDLVELLKQSVGEFSEKFEQKNLTVVENYGKNPHMINADSRRMWRIVENLFGNICKYSLEGTRVYIDIMRNPFDGNGKILLSVKNISAQPLNISPEELTERFIRGDESRTTEGSGLGLSIAKSLTEAQGGTLTILLDGDLFKVILLFDEAREDETAQPPEEYEEREKKAGKQKTPG